MTMAATFKQQDVKRAVAGAMRAGLSIGKISIAPDGTITIIPDAIAANDDDGPSAWDDE